jgi:hypothetical protein
MAMTNIEDRVRDAPITGDPLGIFYRTLFIGENFYVYRHVEKGRGYRGNFYDEEGYVLAWSDIQNVKHDMPSSFVRRRP